MTIVYKPTPVSSGTSYVEDTVHDTGIIHNRNKQKQGGKGTEFF
jgi:hypothetical protein